MPTAGASQADATLSQQERASVPPRADAGGGRGESGLRTIANDPLALRSPRLVAGFTRYLNWYVGRNFHAIRVSRAGLPSLPAGPVVIYCNHPSWWDPVLLFVLAGAFTPGRPGYGPMEQAALARYGVFRRLGVFGIEPGRPGAARFLAVSRRVLAEPGNVLWITAEGAFADPRARPLRLRPGLAHLMRAVPDAAVVPLAIEYPFWNERTPEALVRFGAPVPLDRTAPVAAITAQLAAALADTMDALGAEASGRDPAPFLTLRTGRVGVGGAYDAWRRVRALLTLRRFHAAHEPHRPQ